MKLPGAAIKSILMPSLGHVLNFSLQSLSTCSLGNVAKASPPENQLVFVDGPTLP